MSTVKWNLIDIIEKLTTKFTAITEIYLFGSRAYKTDSLRSDIDLLVVSERPIPASFLFEWIQYEFPPLDIFKTVDKQSAESVINGSVLFVREGYDNLPIQLDAKLLWTRVMSFDSKFTEWEQLTREGIEFKATFAYLPKNIGQAIKDFEKFLNENEFPNTNLGSSWDQIAGRLIRKIEGAMLTAKSWTGESGTFKGIKLSNERDFQNFVELIYKPWLPDTQRETCAAKFDGQSKNIDFSIQLDRILIEAKHIKDANTEAKVVKEIEGISKFYLANTNVNLLLFFCLVENGYPKDIQLFESTFTKSNKNTIVIAKCFNNTLK